MQPALETRQLNVTDNEVTVTVELACLDPYARGPRPSHQTHHGCLVSNSAGTKHDAGQVQAESVSYHLSVPVLRHNAPKPAYACIGSIRAYFSTLKVPVKDEELVVVGDRIFTDVVIANRMHRRSGGGPLAVWTTGVWQRESMVMRWFEKQVVEMVARWTESKTSTDFVKQ
ncbi:mitochondrial PGP phosphatase-domain-containing protein [Chiua virens]|nr:mitochondrial PGP phosphatase-domain-containing protein [Chiua virens]